MLLLVLAGLALARAAQLPPNRHAGCPEGSDVCVYPVSGAEFLPGVLFDFRVDVMLDAAPEAVTVGVQLPGAAAEDADFFAAADAVQGSYSFEYYEDILHYWAHAGAATQQVYSFTWPAVSLPASAGGGDAEVAVYVDGAEALRLTWTVREPAAAQAKSAILFVGDGMTQNMISAARVVSRGQVFGKTQGALAMDEMDEVGLLNPSGLDSIITDSANSATSYHTGHKTCVRAIGVYCDASEDNFDDPKLETLSEHLRRTTGKSIGVVTTAYTADATPAGAYGHSRSRYQHDALVAQMLDGVDGWSAGGVRADVFLGGGGAHFHEPGADAGCAGRADARDLYADFQAAGYEVVYSAAELAAADPASGAPLLGIFNADSDDVTLDRVFYPDNIDDPNASPVCHAPGATAPTDQPGLQEMTLAALERLTANDEGFFLLVEGASIDKQMHKVDADRMVAELIEFDNTIGAVREFLAGIGQADDTLLVATADHGQGFDVFGTVDTDLFQLGGAGAAAHVGVDGAVLSDEAARRYTIGVYDLAGHPDYEDADGDHFPDSWDVRTTLAYSAVAHPDLTEDYRVAADGPREAAVEQNETDAWGNAVFVDNPADDPDGLAQPGNLPFTRDSSVHSLTDVSVFSAGPCASMLGRHHENIEVFFTIATCLGVGHASSSDDDSTSAWAALGIAALVAVAVLGAAIAWMRREEPPVASSALGDESGGDRAEEMQPMSGADSLADSLAGSEEEAVDDSML